MTPTVASIILRRPLVSLDRLPGLELWLSTKDAADIVVGGGTASIWHDVSGKSAVMGMITNGVAGNYGSAPSSAALNIGATFSLLWDGAPQDWTPAGARTLVGKSDSTTDKRQYRFG